MTRRALLLVALASALGGACHGQAPSSLPAVTVRDAGDPPTADPCRAAHQRPGGPVVGTLEIIASPSAHDGIFTREDTIYEATVRVLSITPLRFELVEGSRGAEAPSSWSWVAATPAAAADLVGLRFGEVVRIHYLLPPIRNAANADPFIVTSVERVATHAETAPLVAELRPGGWSEIEVYADGRALVALADERVEVNLSAAELRGLLRSFARTGFNDLPPVLESHAPIRSGEIILSCARYQRVGVMGQERALAPVLEAFAEVRARAEALRAPVLYIDRRDTPVRILTWPADAPPLADLPRLHAQAEQHPEVADPASPLYHPLSGDVKAAVTARRRTDVPVPYERWLARDGGALRGLYDLGCAYGAPVCLPDTYAVVGIDVEGVDAPDGAPDFSTIGPDGLRFDEAEHPRWMAVGGHYLQGNTLYAVRVARRAR